MIELRLPPLRERRDDIDRLAAAILGRLAAPGCETVLAPAAIEALRAYAFPGNVRELENILERALAFANHGVIEVADLALKPPAQPVADAVAAAEASRLVPAVPQPQPSRRSIPRRRTRWRPNCRVRCRRIWTKWSARSSGAHWPGPDSTEPRRRNCLASVFANCAIACSGCRFASVIDDERA